MYEHTINTFLRVSDWECLPHITNPPHVLETVKACNSRKKGLKRQGFRQDIKKSELAPVHSRCNTEIRGEDTYKVWGQVIPVWILLQVKKKKKTKIKSGSENKIFSHTELSKFYFTCIFSQQDKGNCAPPQTMDNRRLGNLQIKHEKEKISWVVTSKGLTGHDQLRLRRARGPRWT